jgi:hypothetical protein
MQRLAAWLYTGPLGHLYGGVADWAEFFSRFAWARARARVSAAGRSATGRARP